MGCLIVVRRVVWLFMWGYCCFGLSSVVFLADVLYTLGLCFFFCILFPFVVVVFGEIVVVLFCFFCYFVCVVLFLMFAVPFDCRFLISFAVGSEHYSFLVLRGFSTCFSLFLLCFLTISECYFHCVFVLWFCAVSFRPMWTFFCLFIPGLFFACVWCASCLVLCFFHTCFFAFFNYSFADFITLFF